MNPQEITKKILWLGIEDYSGLWEILWELNSQYPELAEAKRYELAQSTLQTLVDKGYLSLYRCQEPYGELTEIPFNEVRSLIHNSENWKEPKPDSLSLRISTTQEGEAAYITGIN